MLSANDVDLGRRRRMATLWAQTAIHTLFLHEKNSHLEMAIWTHFY
jgi:hypothetical protein